MGCKEKVIENGKIVEKDCYSNKEPDLDMGPGTELKKILSKIGIVATKNCSCNARAKLMNINELKEPGWCLKNIDTIVEWLREEANKRKLIFIDSLARLIIKRAIRNYQKSL